MLTVTHTVKNEGDGAMYFSIGAHPGFNCKIGDRLEFAEPEKLICEKIDTDSILDGKHYPTLDNETTIVITKDIFEGPTLSGNMYFLRPTMGVKKLTCESRVVKNGKRIRVVEATIYGDNGQEIARSLLEYMDMQREMIVK